MNHIVTLKEIMPAMETELMLASSISAKTKRKKKLYFYPAELTYRVKFEDENSVTSNAYRHPQDAVDKYNELNA